MNTHVNKSKQVKDSSLGHEMKEIMNELYDLYLHNEYKERVCPFCGKTFVGYGNNSAPVSKERCCDKCNKSVVIPARIKQYVDMLNNQNGVNNKQYD